MMIYPRFFCPGPLAVGASVELPENAARHAARALRLGAGEWVTLFDGAGGEYEACIAAVRKDAVAVDIRRHDAVERESALAVTLIQALQSGDKMDLTIQKAVELGVREIRPVASRRSVVRLDGERAGRRTEHWRSVAASACEQCGRNRVPAVAGIEPLEAALARPANGALRLMLAPGATCTLDALPAARQVELLVGAEGGLDSREVAAAQAAGFIGVRLGPRVLRTETAGLAAMAALQALWGDFRNDAAAAA